MAAGSIHNRLIINIVQHAQSGSIRLDVDA
jgi:hypothetical protein